LAIEYSYRLRKSSPQTWVFWIHCGSTLAFEKGFEEIAKKASIFAYDETDPNRLDVVSNWLSDEANRWLIILDNADDLGVLLPEEPSATAKQDKEKRKDEGGLTSRPTRDLLALLPQTSNGSYIITSRSKQAATRLTLGEHQNILPVTEMTPSDALALLHNKLAMSPSSPSDAEALVQALEYMPLAISQACAFINEMSDRWTISRFIEELQKGDDDRDKLLEEDVYDARRDVKAGYGDRRSNSVIRTWHISFEHIRRHRPSAARLLSLMSLFDSLSIPEELLVGRYGEQKVRRGIRARRKRKKRYDEVDGECNFEEDWRTLTSFSLLTTELSTHHFSMHKLVQHSTKKWLELHGELQMWQTNFVGLMRESYPRPNADNVDYCIAISSHAQAAVACWPLQGNAALSWAYLLHNLAEYALLMGKTGVCNDMNRAAFRIFEKMLGWGNLNTLRSAYHVGLALYREKKYIEAEELHRRVLKGRQKKLGLEHPETLDSMGRLGEALIAQGKQEEGNALWAQVLEIQERLAAHTDEAVVSMIGNAWRLSDQGRYDEAELIIRRIADIQKKVLGEGRQYWDVMERLGNNLRMQGKYKQAERIHRAVIDAQERRATSVEQRRWGSAPTFVFLADALAGQEKYEQAEKYLSRALESYKKYYGDTEEESRTLKVMEKLAQATMEQEKFKEAERWARKAVEGREKTLGEEHEDTLWACRTFADVLKKSGQNEEALDLYQKTYARFQESQPDHPDLPEFLDAYNTQRELMATLETERHFSALPEEPDIPSGGPADELTRQNTAKNSKLNYTGLGSPPKTYITPPGALETQPYMVLQTA
jgi:tetratricopeptide (TPR) repeat protein